jgi:CBS domain-containing protein
MTVAPGVCLPFSTEVEATLVLRDRGHGFLPVVDAGRPVGVLPDRDPAVALLEYGRVLATVLVSELMSPVSRRERLPATLSEAIRSSGA